ncbi:family 16 glycosylhydrolase [Nonlabens marinus]|uniref:Beta-glucanase n=1 Tax=Nonlabens marinus S1-08 TaxID=1454201 RepID=W8VWW4_9FLAO|nr:family 16 glycosylhydrolase [Nonlabens marinus]BAO55112.1 beta-glucanase precursor [Nonlabens marinus S1-08]
MPRFLLSLFLIIAATFSAFSQQMPIDFSDSQDVFTGFSGASFSQASDPQDGSNRVGRFQNSGNDLYEGFFIDLDRPVDTNTDKIINTRVYVFDNQAHSILIKLERGTENDVEVPKGIPAGMANRWVDLSFDFGNAVVSGTSTVINADGAYDRLTVFLEPNESKSGVFLIDDMDDGSTPTNQNRIDVEYTELVWSDEFETTAGSKQPINPNNWFHQTKLPSGGSWFNGEVQHYTDRIENSYMENGFLYINAKRETFTDQGETKQFTSARLNSKFAFTYGRIDVRAKLPFGDGTWPAIWTLGKNINEDGGYWDDQFGTVSWPACGEIDVMEHGLAAPNEVSSALHTPSSFGNTVNVKKRMLDDVANNFYVYSMNWSPNQITFLIDDVPYYTYNPTVKDNSNYPFTKDQYILLNVAMGGIAGNIDPGFTQSPMVIDYVRVYQENTASEDDINGFEFILYPNPAADLVQIKAQQNIDTVELYNLLGSKIEISLSTDNSFSVNELSSGIYFLKVYAGAAATTKRLLVK